MRRKRLLVALAAIMCVAVGVAAVPHFLPAQPGKADPVAKGGVPGGVEPGAAKGNGTALPVKKVVLFTSGVGFFQREGQVDGSTRVDLSFPVQDINDLLKSLVLRDLNGGKVSTVSYDSQDPLEKTLKSFAINLSGNPSFAEILNQARGEKVTVTWVPINGVQPQTATGTIVGVETKKQPVAKDAKEPVEVEYLTIFSEKGLQSLKLTEVIQVQLLSSTLSGELNRALDVVAQGHDTQKKGLSLFFKGQGKRTVQVGYVVSHPIWRTSYRLVLDKEGKPFLQGWALVENPSNEDWNDVNLSLVSGRPVSFKMDLYQPLYVDRPTVQLQLFGNLKPPTYEADMDMVKGKDKGKGDAPGKQPPAEKGPGFPGGGPPAPPPPGPSNGPGSNNPNDGKGYIDQMKDTAAAAAQGVKLGDQFQYVIGQPVSIARQKSALVPIVNVAIDGDRVSIFNESNLAKFPMLGLKLKNTTNLHLMQGPITVFNEDSYAGDSLINDVQPKEERLISYAVDLGAEVKTESKRAPDTLAKMSLTKGIIHKTIIQRDIKTYTVKNRSDHEKLVIIEHPNRSPDYKLIAPAKPAKTQSYYRFDVKVPAEDSKSLEVVEEKKVYDEIILTNANDQTLALLIKSPDASPAMKTALQKAIELKVKWAKTEAEVTKLNGKISTIKEDQNHQVGLMKVIPQGDPAYKKYLDALLKGQEQLTQLRSEVEKLQVTATEQRQAYEDYLLNLTIKEEKE